MDLAAAVRDGIQFMTHKCAEGHRWYTDDRFDDYIGRARAAKVPLIGAYFVNHPGTQADQVEWFISLLDAKARGWRDGPFIIQLDAEKFEYMDREPSAAEIRQWCDEFVKRVPSHRPVVYAPKWLYGDSLKGLPYPLWASNYGSNPAKPYRDVYPGDGSTRWAKYSGQTPAILQYGSRTIIGSQKTCDANAYRGTLAELAALVTGDDMTVTEADAKKIAIAVWAMTWAEYFDENGNKILDPRRVVDIVFAGHSASVQANSGVKELAGRQPAAADVAVMIAAMKSDEMREYLTGIVESVLDNTKFSRAGS